MNEEEANEILSTFKLANRIEIISQEEFKDVKEAIKILLTAYEKEKEKNNRYKELLIKVLSLNSEISEEKEILLDAFSRRKRGVKMNEIDDLDVGICDWSYQEGLSEIINNLKTVKVDTRAMNETSEARLIGQEEMLKKVIDYLERCL